ncbi:Fic family protein [Fluviicola taffensis]|uniref:Transcriptional regulator, XRE family n=1 Tax=Fluviicola taffensis (strain DSM 16823 / NCIMB 13979 / RW262) TaxID=755732 RepID=F2ID45_FLUTR|nr:Fic family protein [Fluviicola taffensis]AEA44439.1 transcriptional regulator, XRE family [Fluviicola taffensis DSM 16823]
MKEILQNARKAKGLLSRELANLLGVDQSLISKFENGKRLPSEKQLIELSNVLSINLDELKKAWLTQKILGDVKKYTFAEEVLFMVNEALASYAPKREFEDLSIEKTLDEIDSMKKNLDQVREFENYRITEALELEYTYESNRIEGNTLTLRETDMVVNKGLTVSGKSLVEHLEAINHGDAIHYVKELVSKNSILTKRELLSIHNLILRGINQSEAGKFRRIQVMIQGSSHLPPPPYLVEKQMEDYFIWYERNRGNLHPVVLAAEMHERLVTIHPFIDGNGRTSRLIMNMILLQNGLVIANMKGDNTSRYAYYEALESVQSSGKKDSFIRYVAEIEKQSLERYLSILK